MEASDINAILNAILLKPLSTAAFTCIRSSTHPSNHFHPRPPNFSFTQPSIQFRPSIYPPTAYSPILHLFLINSSRALTRSLHHPSITPTNESTTPYPRIHPSAHTPIHPDTQSCSMCFSITSPLSLENTIPV